MLPFAIHMPCRDRLYGQVGGLVPPPPIRGFEVSASESCSAHSGSGSCAVGGNGSAASPSSTSSSSSSPPPSTAPSEVDGGNGHFYTVPLRRLPSALEAWLAEGEDAFVVNRTATVIVSLGSSPRANDSTIAAKLVRSRDQSCVVVVWWWCVVCTCETVAVN